jgi:pyruvate dehydrogenase E2 component (dihydrolipoyllysine-residue acetyltransferase)
MAKIDIVMPQMGESIAEGTLVKWLKRVGDPVKRDEPIFEISTDKVDTEISAPTAGVLAEILVQEGQTVPVQTLVARLETDASAPAASPAPAPAPPASSAPPPAPKAAPIPAAPAPPPRPAPAPAPVTLKAAALGPRPERAETGGAGAGGATVESLEERLRRKSTPLVRKIAAEHNLDITSIPGSGLAGRVTKNDLLSFIDAGPVAPATALPSGPDLLVGPGVRVIPGPVVEPWEGDRVESWSRIRKLTADHMIMSRRVSAHVQSMIEIDYTRIAGIRARQKALYADRGVNLTYLAFITLAVARNLRKHPVLNACVMGESTIYRRDVNIGIAVAMDWGLIVPVIRHADELNLLGMARSISDLAERARTKKLSPDEVQKGTFTITNPGVFGTFVGLPVINQPQSAILAVGAIGKRPAVVAGADGSDTIGIRTQGMLALSFDHRIVDGAGADRFLADLRATLVEFPEEAV